jgi:hypothetical protein
MYGFVHVIILPGVAVNKNNITEEREKCGVTFSLSRTPEK